MKHAKLNFLLMLVFHRLSVEEQSKLTNIGFLLKECALPKSLSASFRVTEAQQIIIPFLWLCLTPTDREGWLFVRAKQELARYLSA